MSRDTVEIAKELLSENASLRAKLVKLAGEVVGHNNMSLAFQGRAEKAEAQLAELAKQEPVGYTYNRGINCEIVTADLNDDCPCGVDLYTRPAPAPVVGGRTMPRHEFAQMVNELREVPAVQSKREKIVSILHAFNINPAGGSVADE